ncbi:MAG: divergent polysaccharide deacetylase family protein [Thalassotalea sp.]
MRLLLALLLINISALCAAKQAQVAIIIDDIGYRKSDISTLTIPGDITFAILPHTPYGKSLAEIAYQSEHDVILHIPMESSNDTKALGPGALTSDMSEASIRTTLASAFDEIPFAIGINNHMGSHLTTLYKPMAWTMRYLKEQNMIFVDSVTTNKSKARKVARHFGVPNLSRRIFLDNQLDKEYITQQFHALIKYAKRNKTAIAIAHPHPETVEALTTLIPLLAQHDIELVAISKLITPPPSQIQAVHTDE